MALPYPTKMRIVKRDGFKCRYCGLDASSDFDTWYYANLNVDHVDPKGGDDDSNLVSSCRMCNLNKGAHECKSFDEAKVWVLKKREESRDWFNKYVKGS